MSTIIHGCVDVQGVLTNWSRRKMKGLLRDAATGRSLSGDEVKAELLNELSQGHLFLPMCTSCDNHDWKSGCRGHPVPPRVES